MRSLRITGSGTYELLELPTPEPGMGELLLAPMAVGICATDLELLDGSMVYLRTERTRLPLTPGHEWAATVVEIGDAVTGFVLGDLVVGECSIGCGVCETCQEGAYHRCARRRETGIMNLDGALAERMVFPARSAHRVPAGVSPLDAALVEPLAIAYRAVQRSGPQPGQAVLVVGAGTIGLLVTEILGTLPDVSAHVLEPNEHRQHLAEVLGAAKCHPAQVFEHVIEASGSPAGLGAAYMHLAPGGRLVLVGLTGEPFLPLPVDEVVVNDQELVGSLGSPGVWPQVLAMLAESHMKPCELVTHQFPLAEFDAAVALATQKLPTTGKIVILPSGVSRG